MDVSMIERFELLIPQSIALRQELQDVALMCFPIVFLVAVAIYYLKEGMPNWAELIRRMIITFLLMFHFLEIAAFIHGVFQGIALKIDDLNSLENFFTHLKAKSDTYRLSPFDVLMGFQDVIMGVVIYLSFLAVFLARYLLLAIYHFYWLFYTVLSPLMVLCYMFKATSPIVGYLFKGLFQVSLWPVVWAVISFMMRGLAFGEALSVEGEYLTVTLLNFVLAFSLLGTPFLVSSLLSGVVGNAGSAVGNYSVKIGKIAAAKVVATRKIATGAVAGGMQRRSR